MNEVTNDLKLLAEMELPPKTDRVGRHVVKLTILCFAVLLLACVGGLVYALRASTVREDNLSASLSCVRASAYEYEAAVGDAVKLLIDLDVPLMDALVAVARGDEQHLNEALEVAEAAVVRAGDINLTIERAIQARRTALSEC